VTHTMEPNWLGAGRVQRSMCVHTSAAGHWRNAAVENKLSSRADEREKEKPVVPVLQIRALDFKTSVSVTGT